MQFTIQDFSKIHEAVCKLTKYYSKDEILDLYNEIWYFKSEKCSPKIWAKLTNLFKKQIDLEKMVPYSEKSCSKILEYFYNAVAIEMER